MMHAEKRNGETGPDKQMAEFEENIKAIETYKKSFRKYNKIRKSVFRGYFRMYHRLEVIGLENIPEGPALIAANHGGGLDLDIVALSDCAHPEREIQVLIAQNWHYIRSAWGRYWVGSGIPLWTRGGIRYEYIDPYLKQGGSEFPGLVAIFPEGDSGTFAKRRVLRKFFPGVARIALKYRVPIVPAAMTGFSKACPVIMEISRDHGPNDAICPLFAFPLKLRIEFGKPVLLEEYYDTTLTKHDEIRIANEAVRPGIAELLNKRENIIMEDWDS